MNPATDFLFVYDYDGKRFVFDTREIKAMVAPIPLDNPEISAWIKDCLYQEITQLHGGLFS
jgi:predicted sulfurtransferase